MNKIFTNTGNDLDNFNILKESEIRVINSSEVNQKKHIRLNDETLFQFDCIIEDNYYLILKLSELDALAPFIYIKKITFDEMKKYHKAFQSCENLKEVKEHIDRLFEDKENMRISLEQKINEEIEFHFKIFYISYEDDFTIKAEREMTDSKDEMLLKLYQIQKNQLNGLKKLEKYLKTKDDCGKEIIDKIKEIKEKFDQ